MREQARRRSRRDSPVRGAGSPRPGDGPHQRLVRPPFRTGERYRARGLRAIAARPGGILAGALAFSRTTDLLPAGDRPSSLPLRLAGLQARSYKERQDWVMTMKAAVRDVMSSLPISVLEITPFREIAARLRECRVSAFPVLDADGKVRGVVSEADLLVKEAVLGERAGVGGSWPA